MLPSSFLVVECECGVAFAVRPISCLLILMFSRQSLVAAGAGFLVCAAALVAWRIHVVNSTQWVPIDVPFPAAATRTPAHEFIVDRDGSYELAIKISIPPERTERVRAECLLGFDPGNPKWGMSLTTPPCSDMPVVDLAWYLTSDQGPVVNNIGESAALGRAAGIAGAGGFSIDEVDRWLGSFVARRGLHYTLTVETHANAAALQPFAPRIVIQPSPSINRDEAVTAAFVWLSAAACATAGFAALVVGALRRQR